MDASLDRHEKKGGDWSNEALRRELGVLTNGGRWTDRLGVTGNRVAGAGQATYSETVSWLVARYYDRPEERDGIYALLGQISDEVAPAVRARGRDVDQLIHYLSVGMSVGMAAAMFLDWRKGGYKGVREVREASAGAWTKFAGRFRASAGEAEVAVTRSRTSILGLEIASEAQVAENLAREEKQIMSSQAAHGRWEAETEKAVGELGREGQALVPAEKAAAATPAKEEGVLARMRRLLRGESGSAGTLARPGAVGGSGTPGRESPPEKAMHEKLTKSLGKLASQVARGFLIGGVPFSLYALNEQSEAGKIDPLELLKCFQLFALMEVEIDGSKLAEEARKLAEELKQPGQTPAKAQAARTRLKDLAAGFEIVEKSGDGTMRTRHEPGLKDLRSQFEHLQAHATRFKGVIQYPTTLADIAAYRNKLAALKLIHYQEERVTAFLSASKELETRIVAVDEKIRAEAEARGFAPGAQLAASLAAADMQLQSAEQALRALSELSKPKK
jgi:hypothetical protein